MVGMGATSKICHSEISFTARDFFLESFLTIKFYKQDSCSGIPHARNRAGPGTLIQRKIDPNSWRHACIVGN